MSFGKCERKCSMKFFALRFGNCIQAWTPAVRRAIALRSPYFGKVSKITQSSRWRAL